MIVESFYFSFIKQDMASAGSIDMTPSDYLAYVKDERLGKLHAFTVLNRGGLTVEFTNEFGKLKFRDVLVGSDEELASVFTSLMKEIDK